LTDKNFKILLTHSKHIVV